jgi:hypothetical protein
MKIYGIPSGPGLLLLQCEKASSSSSIFSGKLSWVCVMSERSAVFVGLVNR